jgi:hypothetical protein
MPPMTPMPAGTCAEIEDQQVEFEERAAVMEFDGGMSRAEAEDLAAERVYPDTASERRLA